MKIHPVVVCSVVVLATGCSMFTHQEKRINYTEALDSNDWPPPSLVTDAKQRAIINTKARVGVGDFKYKLDSRGKPYPDDQTITNDGVVKNHPDRIICAEPSPDVAQAISAAFTAAAKVDIESAQGVNAGGSGSIGSSYVSSIAKLGERLATVQLLRDKMYRACEAYQNGAISDTSYTLMLARFDKTMASMLASEIAAGAFGRNLAALGGQASTDGVDPKELAAARKAAKSASDDLQKAVALPETDDAAKAAKKTAIEGAAGKVKEAVADLAALEFKSLITSAQSGPAGGGTATSGQIVGRSAVEADVVAGIHTNFLDDDASGTIIDACVIALDRNRISGGTDDALAKEIAEARSEAAEKKGQAGRAKTLAQMESETGKGGKPNKEEEHQLFGRTLPSNGSNTKEDKGKAEAEAEAKEAEAEAEAADQKLKYLRSLEKPSLASICAKMLSGGDDISKNFLLKLQEKKLQARNVARDFLVAEKELVEAKAKADAILISACLKKTKGIPDIEGAKNFIACLATGRK